MAREFDMEKERLIEQPPPRRIRVPALGLVRVNYLIPFLFLSTIIVTLVVMMKESRLQETYRKYSVVEGYFTQDDANTLDKGFDYSTTNFGLINQVYDKKLDPGQTQWQRFAHELKRLDGESSKSHYKVLFLGRHGEGYHNVAEAYYGTKAWDCYWAAKDGNETSTWADARLTPIGQGQALKANKFWARLIEEEKIKTPESYYSSPLTRCCETASLTFEGLNLSAERPFTPLIKELLREANGVHTCDRRSNKTEIKQAFPKFRFEENFNEADELWSPTLRETDSSIDVRTKTALDDIFATDANTWISISSHSGAIASMLRVLGHRKFGLGTGQVIPVLVKAEMVKGVEPIVTPEPWQPIDLCDFPPVVGGF